MTVALLTVLLTMDAANRREVDVLAADAGDIAPLVTFRLKLDVRQAPRWQPEDIEYLGGVDGVERVEWRSGWLLAQRPGSRHVIPLVDASPGLVALMTTGPVTGRLFREADSGEDVLVVGTEIARRLFGESPEQEYVGRRINMLRRSYEVVGVVDQLDAAYRAMRMPQDRSGSGRYHVNDVYVEVSRPGNNGEVLRVIQEYLDRRPGLEMLEAVTFREFVAGGVSQERVAFLREADRLFRFLVVLVCGFAVLNLFNVVSVASHRSLERWALVRALGSSRRALLVREVLLGNVVHFVAVGVGVAAGLLAGLRFADGSLTFGVVAGSLSIGLLSVLVGSAPALARAIPLHPASALRRGAVFRRGGAVAMGSAAAVTVALALVITAGGVYATGEATLSREIEGIGPELARFVPDRGALLPVASIAPSDVESLRERFPNAGLAFVEVIGTEAISRSSSMEVRLVRADGGYPELSGSRLAEGAWRDDGVVIGATVAARLFPEGQAVGETLTLSGIGSRPGEIPVVGVSMEPTTDRLESLQLEPNAIWLPTALVSDARSPGARIYLDLGTLNDADVLALTQALNARNPDRAPFEPVELSLSFQNYLASLTAQRGRFQMAAWAMVPLVMVALGMMAVAGAESRRYRRAVERVLGGSWRDRFRRELRAGVGGLLVVCVAATLLGTAGLVWWSGAAGHAFRFPAAWVAVAVAAVLLIGVPATLVQARRSLYRAPATDLNAEGGAP